MHLGAVPVPAVEPRGEHESGDREPDEDPSPGDRRGGEPRGRDAFDRIPCDRRADGSADRHEATHQPHRQGPVSRGHPVADHPGRAGKDAGLGQAEPGLKRQQGPEAADQVEPGTQHTPRRRVAGQGQAGADSMSQPTGRDLGQGVGPVEGAHHPCHLPDVDPQVRLNILRCHPQAVAAHVGHEGRHADGRDHHVAGSSRKPRVVWREGVSQRVASIKGITCNRGPGRSVAPRSESRS